MTHLFILSETEEYSLSENTGDDCQRDEKHDQYEEASVEVNTDELEVIGTEGLRRERLLG